MSSLAEPLAPPRGRSPAVAGVAVVALLLAGPLPMLLKLGRSLWDREQYQFFPLMIAGAAAVAWERWQDLPDRRSLRRGSTAVTGSLLAGALAVLVASAVLWVRSLSLVSTLLILTAVAWHAGGGRLLRAMVPSLVLLAIVIPPPGHQEQVVTLRLQHMAVGVSCSVLDALRVPNVQAGNVIEIPGRRLLIEQACSGINSLMAVLAFTLLYGFYLRRRGRRLAVLLPAAVAFVVGGNVARITTEAVLWTNHHVDVTGGFAHQLLGMLLFGGCVGLVASADQLLGGSADGWESFGKRAGSKRRRPLRERPMGRQPTSIDETDLPPGVRLPPDPDGESQTRPPRRWPTWATAVAFACVGVWVEARVGSAWLPPAIAESATFDLPPTLAGWDRVSSGPTYVERPQTEAAKSFVWQYRRGDAFASVALDYPFTGYHELVVCYSVSGWAVRSERADLSEGFSRVTLDKHDSDGYLLFAQQDEAGRPVGSSPLVDRDASAWAKLRFRLGYARQMAIGGASYQVQALMQSSAAPTAEQRRAADELFRAARRQLTTQLLAQLGRGR